MKKYLNNTIIGKYIKKRLFYPLLKFLKQGITPKRLALTVVFGFCLGIIPVIGTTTILCTIASIGLRLNFPSIQLVNWFFYPLQLIFFVPFFKLGELIFNAPHVPLSVIEIIKMAKNNWWGVVQDLWYANIFAVLVWVIVCIPIGLLIYYSSFPVFKKYAARYTDMDNNIK